MAEKKPEKTIGEIVDDHKPKNFKFKYIFKDEEYFKELLKSEYDVMSLDTICDDKLVEAALQAEYQLYDSSIVGKAKEPSFLDNGIIISKKLVTKAGKKLLNLGVAFFMYNGYHYIGIKLIYEKFDIIEIFNSI